MWNEIFRGIHCLLFPLKESHHFVAFLSSQCLAKLYSECLRCKFDEVANEKNSFEIPFLVEAVSFGLRISSC